MISAIDLAAALGQPHPPTQQQAQVIEHPLSPLLVVAGAGAGKTETMAARVVWLVANGLISPEKVLGLTFTRKAAQQLGRRIRGRLGQLASLPEITLDGNLAPVVKTYDAFSGTLIGEFGLLLPVELSSRMITHTELFRIAHQVVTDYEGALTAGTSTATITTTLLELVAELDNHMITHEDLREETDALVRLIEDAPPGPRQRAALPQDLHKLIGVQRHREEYLPLIRQLKEILAKENLMTFGEQMNYAARLVREHPSVVEALRGRFDAVFLDEYQDTSHAQRMLLSTLFEDTAITAVGDPMQAIYGWRGATASNLARFVTDFSSGDPAPTRALTVSFRNPAGVLGLANTVADEVLGAPGSPRRTVPQLSALPAKGEGRQQLAFFPTPEEEITWVADQLAEEFHRESGRGYTAAVLVRASSHIAPIAQALSQRAVPVEIVGLSGLIDIPEVADLIAVARLVRNPGDDAAALRVLTGPMVGLGVADLKALGVRSKQLGNPTSGLHTVDSRAHLGDAIADLGEAPNLSAAGLHRITRLGALLRRLRTVTTTAEVADFFAAVEQAIFLREEVLSREDPTADGAAGTTHLEKFSQYAAEFTGTIDEFLEYVELARTYDKGLTPGEVRVRGDRVQILTVHKAKGLEWGTVAVIRADAKTYGGPGETRTKVRTWLTAVGQVPTTLRGDASENNHDDGAPQLDLSDVGNRKELQDAINEHKEEIKAGAYEESVRLFYVAMTRAEHRLLVTGSGKTPFAPLGRLKEAHPELVSTWMSTDDAAEDHEHQQPEGSPPAELDAPATYPPAQAAHGLVTAADEVRAAMDTLPAAEDDGGLMTTWEKETTAILGLLAQEEPAGHTGTIPVELTASDVVSLYTDVDQFLTRHRRPLPFKPNAFAKRGTAFHEWLDAHYGGSILWEESDFPGSGEVPVAHKELSSLKEAFLASTWAALTPIHSEYPFEITVGGHVLRGRMDAVFHIDGRWVIVDWKTGRVPVPSERESVRLQLAVYRAAWARLSGVPEEQIDAKFYYVRAGQELSFPDLPGEEEIARLITDSSPKTES